MVFSSLTFLCVFLPISFLIYYILPSIKIKNYFLCLVSLVFYAYGEPVYVLLMAFSVVMNFSFGRMLSREKNRKSKIIVTTAVLMNLGGLAFFKYMPWLIGNFNEITSWKIPIPQIVMPIGISFYTFQALSYVIDVYRGTVKAQRKLLYVMLYVSFFPQLIAGPIVRYHDIESQISCREHNLHNVASGLCRFICGLAKKILIANQMANVVDYLFGIPTDNLNILSSWLAAIAYMLQIYFDFSGYSDMAIGLGRVFGFEFLENFRYPYIAQSIQEFWRRWHISLSTWFKEYLYIPLGGNRKGRIRTNINRMIVFLCTGLWHGANWTFLFWGAYHGLLLSMENIVSIKRFPKILRHFYVLLTVCLGFVIFRAETLKQGLTFIRTMFVGVDFNYHKMQIFVSQLGPRFLTALLMGIILSVPIKEVLAKRLKPHTYELFGLAGSTLLLVLSILTLSSGGHNPFIYFRF
ncbi:MBOAT family O-acyltransferase [Ohessyouella blattaphilus]|uniref:MBOAT family protein n=1 Tax=Ohessyouella blattaphilus TaxID=2949333 RepID=A0ABT1ELI2_9FIRM|nr:MBOAT family protein [Ohessyouella blattaphilus]MCP1110132.1 MBOAT family protein [Ohessyouella blattaphilus]MCR8563526.1 MBOAT family protein [Ohessyouella blattaphilus]